MVCQRAPFDVVAPVDALATLAQLDAPFADP